MMSGRNRFPFTATQWQELEHQALIFKYMVSGNPIPPDLLFTVKSSLDSSLSSKLILHQPQHLGWNCFQMGLGRKIDPEPGRCRRTDGKKWRCSKEAYPDSKYCERHMHRGRNRSRKPVEAAMTTSTTDTSGSVTQNPSPSSVSSLSSVASDSHHHHHNHPSYNNHLHHHFLYPHSSSSRPSGHDFSSQEINTHLLLDSSPCSNPDKNNRYGYGMKEEVSEQAFFSESSSMEDPWKLTPLSTGSSLAHLKQRACSGLQSGGYPFLQHQGLTDTSKQQNTNFFEMPPKADSEDQPKKVMHHFFDEWPKNKDSWADSEGKSSDYVPVSTTQLSISIPNSSYDFFMTHNGN
ncbi:hypothetical protein Vadar_005712 [Vaccinium darrowii]|uniref:Uncharacterized protein n=1 Tax=Vaccinium darrowii TaxID=229202 RepID=A0ACB7YJK1_9ERIC|nr:hypothetical protein Vadar_005712 [Vaccinium darrowii]